MVLFEHCIHIKLVEILYIDRGITMKCEVFVKTKKQIERLIYAYSTKTERKTTTNKPEPKPGYQEKNAEEKRQEKTDNPPLKNMNQAKSKTMEGQSTTWSSVSSHELEAKERTTAELLRMQIGWDKICTDKGRIMSFAHDCNEH